MKDNQTLLVSSSPHLHHRDSTSGIMLDVVIALAPAGIWGAYVFGARSIAVMAISVVSALISEYLMCRLTKKGSLGDFSALVTGILIGYNMPSGVALYVPAMASVFAIMAVKWTFGGLGSNIMNPALAGRVFVFFSWTGTMTKWSAPATNSAIDSISGASPLGYLKTSLMDITSRVSGPSEILSSYPASSLGNSVSEWFNSALGARIKPLYFDLFFGNISGCIGEISAFLLIAGAVYLLIRKVITWEIPVSYILSFSLLIWIFDGLRFGTGLFTGDVFFHLFSGGLMLGALYMATDMVTSPLSSKGQLIFGVGCGFLTFLIRVYGSFPEGVSLAIIIMNICVAMIDRVTPPKLFGFVPREMKK